MRDNSGYRHWTSPISSLDFTLHGQNIVTGLHPLSSLDLTPNARFYTTDPLFLRSGTNVKEKYMNVSIYSPFG